MNVLKSIKIPVVAGTLIISAALLTGCGGVSEAQFAELNALRQDVRSRESEANSLKDERASLEAEISDMNRKLAECNKQKEETSDNLERQPK